MRISGDAEQCARAGVTLLRTATSISTAAQALQQTRWSHPGWLGTAAQGWSSLSGAQATNGFALADRIAAAGRALLQHAEALEELQQRARGLRTEALDAGLDLDDDGWIRPVESFIGPASNPAQAQAALLASHRQAVRADLLRRVALVRQDQELAQQRLARVLQGIAADLGCGPGIGRGARGHRPGGTCRRSLLVRSPMASRAAGLARPGRFSNARWDTSARYCDGRRAPESWVSATAWSWTPP